MAVSICEGCGENSFLIPLHGGKGGPLRCPLCVGKWNAEHGRRRRTGRVVIRAIKAFFDAGGKSSDIEKLKTSAVLDGAFFTVEGLNIDPLGYMTDIAKLDAADIDVTFELLADILKLTHPDHHPVERKELAHRVTQKLLALKPFVFPAPKPKVNEPVSSPAPAPTISKPKEKIAAYPCPDCADSIPKYYCDACCAEYDKREREETERERKKRREQYARRRQRRLRYRAAPKCAECGKEFKSKRDDSRFCSDRCRQKAHRKPVTDKTKPAELKRFKRDTWRRRILALVDKHQAVFQNDLLPSDRTRAQYQQLALIAAKLEAEGKIGTWYYGCSYGKPGFKLLTKPGVEPDTDHPDKIYRLKDNERLPAA